MSYDPDALADSLRRIAISCMPIEQRINLGERNEDFRQEESQVPYHINVVHIDMKRRCIEVNIDKHSFLLKNYLEKVKVTVSDGNGQSSIFPMPEGLSLHESLKKITDYFLGRPGTIIKQFFISSEKVLETCNVPQMVHQRYIVYDCRDLQKALTIKCPETFVFERCFKVSMIRTVYQQFKTLNFTDGMALEIGSIGIEDNIFPRAREELKDLNPKLGIQPKHTCYEMECTRPNIEYATHLQCLVFDIEGSDCELVVCLPDHVLVNGPESTGLNFVVRFKVAKKGTVPICEEEDWLSVFDVDGFVSFTNMAE